jgi:peroxiredoxin Q/BCP
MAQLRQDYAAFVERNAVVLVVGPEDAQSFSSYWQAHDLPFIGLPDPDHHVLKLYGQEVKLFKFGRMPAQALIDRAGKIRFIYYGHDMADIPSNAEMLALLDQLIESDRSQPPDSAGTQP